jgi:hypothetical protein
VAKREVPDLIHNERMKLTATWLNTAAATLAGGVIAPVAATTYGAIGAPLTGLLPVAIGFGWLLAALCLHLFARAVLWRLRP